MTHSESCQASSSSRRRSGPVREAQRHVAEVEQQPAEAARDLDGELPAAAAEPDGVAERELRGRLLAGRQVDQLEAAGHEVELAGPGLGADGHLAGALAGPDPARDHDARERRQQVVGDVAQELAALARVGDRAGRPEHPRVVVGDRDRRRPADDVGDRQRDRGPGATAHAPPLAMTRSGAGPSDSSGVASTSVRSAARAAASRRRAVAGGIRPRRVAELAEPVAQPVAVDRDRRPGEHPIDGLVARVRRHEAGIGDEDGARGRRRATSSRRRDRAQPAVEPMSTTSTRRSSVSARAAARADRPSRVVPRRPNVVEQLAQGEPGRVAGGRGGCQQDLALAVAVRRLEPRQLLGHRAREQDGQLRPADRGGARPARPRRRAPAARRGRVARPHRAGPRRCPDRGSPRSSPGVDRVGAEARTRQPVRMAASSSGSTARSDAAIAMICWGGALRAIRRGSMAPALRPGIAEALGELRIGRRRSLEQEADHGLDVDRRRHRQRPDERQR